MSADFRQYSLDDRAKCLSLFDMNCPEYFAPNERSDYEKFLDSNPFGYELCVKNDEVVGAFGLFRAGDKKGRIEWILLDPSMQGGGIGTAVMDRVLAQAKESKMSAILIATSHKAYEFFEKRGAFRVFETKNGWGPGMHRIDMELNV